MIDILAWLVALPLSLSLAYLGIELLFGLRPLAANRGFAASEGDSRVAVLIPAHDEGLDIAETVLSLAQASAVRILVVADNCRDDTAAAARAAGADVVERSDPERRGKGYALAFGREGLALDPPDVVIILDADCRLHGDSAERLAARAVATGHPVQAANLLTAREDVASPLIAVSNFAMLVKNLVRARGLMRLGGGAMLFGTGMAFAWPLFVKLPLATGDAVEDLNLGLHLARQGVRIDLDDRALVTSKAAAVDSSRAQRSRWEHGFLRTALSEGLPLLLRGLAQRSRNLATLGAHLLVPPLALLMLLSMLALALTGTAALVGGSWMPFLLTVSAFGFACVLLLAAWWRHGRATLPFASLVRIPLYIVWKIPIYIGFFTRNQKDWNRTARDGERD